VAWTYQPPADAPAVVLPPRREEGGVTFGCFNSPTKFTARLFAAWAKLLAQVPHSRLLLKGRDLDQPTVREHLLARMRAEGVPVERIAFLPRTSTTADHLAQYAEVDVALDTFPYNGTTTTCEALWMGRPVVTLRGDRHAARVGASLLTAVGRPEWIAETAEAYVATAARLANDLTDRQAFAMAARETLGRSVLLDHRGQSRCFAAALRACWRQKMATRTCAVAA
jgi:predicted O-linked N-acetylglucosamine transferase (SPINDLY family)